MLSRRNRVGQAIQSLKSFPSQVTYQPMDHIRSRPLQASPCLQSSPLPISERTFITGEGKGGAWHSQIFGMHVPGLPELPLSSIVAPAKGGQGGFGSYFGVTCQNQVAPLGVKLLTLKKCGSQPRAARPRSCSAPPPDTDNLQPTGAIAAFPLPAGVMFLGGFSSHRASGRSLCVL